LRIFIILRWIGIETGPAACIHCDAVLQSGALSGSHHSVGACTKLSTSRIYHRGRRLDDGSLDIIRKYSGRLAWWTSEKDKGQTDALNKGFARAKGNIFAWLNSDDTYLPGSVASAVEYFQENSQLGLVYGDAQYINETGGSLASSRRADRPAALAPGYVHIPQQASFFRGDLWRSVGPLDPSFYFAMDYDLWVRLAARAQVKYVPQTWANFRLHTAGKTIADDDRCWPECCEFIIATAAILIGDCGKVLCAQAGCAVMELRRRMLLNNR